MGVGGGCDGAEPRLPGHVTDNTVSTGPRWCRAGKPRAARGAALSTSCFFVVGAVPGGGPDLHGAMLRRAVGPQTGLRTCAAGPNRSRSSVPCPLSLVRFVVPCPSDCASRTPQG